MATEVMPAMDSVAQARAIFDRCVRDVAAIHGGSDMGHKSLDRLVASLQSAYTRTITELADDPQPEPVIAVDLCWELSDEGDYEATSQVHDDGSPFHWRIGLSEEPVGYFTLRGSDPELVPDDQAKRLFERFTEAAATARHLERELTEVPQVDDEAARYYRAYATARTKGKSVDEAEEAARDASEPVIDGPGPYEIASGAGLLGVPGDVIELSLSHPGSPWPWFVDDGRGGVRFSGEGRSRLGHYIIRKHVPAPAIEPPVITGPGEYWAFNDNTLKHEIVKVAPDCGGGWRATGYTGCFEGICVNADGKALSPHRTFRVLGKATFNVRPLSPDEAFKLLGKKVRCKGFREPLELYRAGMENVQLRWTEDNGMYGYDDVSYAKLAQHMELTDGTPLSVKEPVPFAG